MKKQIIINIDPFNIQPEVVEYAIRIARRMDLPILLYSVQRHTVMPVMADTGGQAVSMEEMPPDWAKTVEQKAKEYWEEVKRIYPKTDFEHDLGLLADSVQSKLHELYESATQRSPYMLVMSKSEGYTWWNDVIGTAETAIAEESPCPVLILPENKELPEVKRILYLADQESLENHKYVGFKGLGAFAVNMGAKITVGLIGGEFSTQPQYNAAAAMEKLRMSLPHQDDHEFRFLENIDADELLELAKLTHVDLVAFPFRESNLFERFFEHEVTRELVLKADVPTLVF